MIKDIDWNISPADLHSLTNVEISELAHRTTPATRARLEDAARELFLAKLMVGDSTPWRELVDSYRSTEPFQAHVNVVDDGGVPRVQVTLRERGFGIEGAHGNLYKRVAELVRALEMIEKERELNKENGRAGGRPSVKDEIRQSLERAIEKHGKKMMEQSISWILDRVRDDWYEQHGADASPPSDNTIRSVIEVCLPDHPKVKKKNFKKAGS